MKLLFFTWMNLLFVLSLTAQKSDDYFKTLPQEGGMLYFFQQEEFQSENSRACLLPDFSYRYFEKKQGQDTVLVHATLIDRQRIDKIDRITFKAGSDSFSGQEMDLLFVEKKGKKWHHRYAVKITATEFLSLLQNPDATSITFETSGTNHVFVPKKKWKKNAEVVYGILMMETGG